MIRPGIRAISGTATRFQHRMREAASTLPRPGDDRDEPSQPSSQWEDIKRLFYLARPEAGLIGGSLVLLTGTTAILLGSALNTSNPCMPVLAVRFSCGA